MRFRVTVFVVLLGLIADLGLASPTGDYIRGRRAFDRAQWEKAAQHFRQAIEEEPNSGGMVRLWGVKMEPYTPHYFLGRALFELEDWEGAVAAWRVSEDQGVVLELAMHPLMVEQRAQALARLPLPVDDSGPEPQPCDRDCDLELDESLALVVGASRYRNGWHDLPGVESDVQAVSEALRGHGFEVQVVRDPTRAELVEVMLDFFHRPTSEASRLVFYYAGHGATLPDGNVVRGYIVPVDAPLPESDQRTFLKHAISMLRFKEYAQNTQARHILFAFDSCFSGTVFEVMRSSNQGGSVRELIESKSRLFLTAGDADQEVPDQSLFRRAFIEAMAGRADRDGDGIILGVELGRYIHRQVTDRMPDLTPRWELSNDYPGDFPFETRSSETSP